MHNPPLQCLSVYRFVFLLFRFLSISVYPASLSFQQLVFSEWNKESSFFHYSLSNFKWKQGCKSERSLTHGNETDTSTNDHTSTHTDTNGTHSLQGKTLVSLSGRQKIRGLPPVVVFNQALLDWFWPLVFGLTSVENVTELDRQMSNSQPIKPLRKVEAFFSLCVNKCLYWPV